MHHLLPRATSQHDESAISWPMPKSRRRKRNKATVLRVPPAAMEMLGAQREAFRKKFGRDPGPDDPIFFDPDADQPTPISSVQVEAEVLAAMQKAGVSPAFAYAYKKTGLIGVEGLMEAWPAAQRKEWEEAVKEYELVEQASKHPDRPDPDEWSTQISELLVSPFTKQDLAQVHDCLRAIAPIEARGMKLVTRIELAASFLAHACEHAFESGEFGHGPELFALAEDLVLRRARELYASSSS
jgi:hypothetical protein